MSLWRSPLLALPSLGVNDLCRADELPGRPKYSADSDLAPALSASGIWARRSSKGCIRSSSRVARAISRGERSADRRAFRGPVKPGAAFVVAEPGGGRGFGYRGPARLARRVDGGDPGRAGRRVRARRCRQRGRRLGDDATRIGEPARPGGLCCSQHRRGSAGAPPHQTLRRRRGGVGACRYPSVHYVRRTADGRRKTLSRFSAT